MASEQPQNGGHAGEHPGDDATREQMKRYWSVYKPSLESMMLSYDAKYLSENEQNEILSYLPPYKDKKVLELGAGIGRFTTRLAQISGQLTTVDFIESYIKENEKMNKQFGNVIFLCADVMKLTFPEGTFDVIFSNWLLMYLSDVEVEKLMSSILKWLKPDGYFFFRESCYHPSGNVKRIENPTKYRTPIDYVKLLAKSATLKTRYEMQFAKSVITYIRAHGNPNQLVILAQNVENRPNEPGCCKGDIEEYTIETKLLSSKTPETTDNSSLSEFPGGEHTLKRMAGKLGLKSGQRVLSIGCRSGSVPFFLAKNYGVFVHGVDENIANIHMAIETQGQMPLDVRKKIQFEFTKLDDASLQLETYDLTLSFDLRYQENSSMTLISKAKDCMQLGGHFAFSTFAKGEASTENNQISKYASQGEIEDHLLSSGFCSKEITSSRSMAISWLKGPLANKVLSETDIKTKIELLEKQSLDWIKVIAVKC